MNNLAGIVQDISLVLLWVETKVLRENPHARDGDLKPSHTLMSGIKTLATLMKWQC